MTGLSIRVLKYDAATKEMHEVSAREWSIDTMPNLPLLDTRWPLCQCYRCRGEGTPGELRRG
ncbi:hypothetical protein [Streptomyces calvus]|uniref:hypothetical protein n=1 Tax=Streptomyces calvus TaxID=67282 RepID=UPI00142E9E0E|nr:hypothetical protein [Streptomyces calvus]